MIAILDYGMGNVKSVYNMFKKIGVDAIITSDKETIKSASKYLLPGVGAFDHGIISLKNSAFFEVFEQAVLEYHKPVLGICLGMQLLSKGSEEGQCEGLGWIDAQTINFNLSDKSLSIPHMGWNRIQPRKNPLFDGLDAQSRFYFVHSYHVTCRHDEEVIATAHYGIDFTCSINKGHIYGVQFHPEKSHKYGMQLLKNFGGLPC